MIEELSIAEWLEMDARAAAPTYFARPGWALALADAYPNLRPAPLRIRTGRRDVVVPLMRAHGGPLRWREYRGFPLGAYTCFLREDGSPADGQDATLALNAIARFADAATIVPWPLGPMPKTSAQTVSHETSVVDLSSGIDAALGNVEGIFRRMAGQAERRGVVCSVSRDAGSVDRYYALLEESAKRWGLERPGISRDFIAALVRHGGADVEIWFARAEDRDIAGGVVFYGGSELFFWSAAMLAQYGRLRPSNALNFALMRAAAARGMSWYNLGSSEGLPGVARFKRDLGATGIPYHEIRLERAPFRIYSSVRRAVAARS